MTKEELARYDGREGRKAYGAVNGTIYDFTESALWKGGNHQGMHQAGHDLTEELRSAPHVRALVERFPVVGHLEQNAPALKNGKAPLLVGAILAALAVALFLLLGR